MKLGFLIICDNAYIDEVGRLSIIQAFDIIKATGFPAIHPRMSIVTKWDFESDDKRDKGYKQWLVIVEENSGNEIAKTQEKELTAKPGKNKALLFINNIMGLKFDQEGTYKIQAYIDGKRAEEDTTFEVRKEGN